jgi:hypothetical protein
LSIEPCLQATLPGPDGRACFGVAVHALRGLMVMGPVCRQRAPSRPELTSDWRRCALFQG